MPRLFLVSTISVLYLPQHNTDTKQLHSALCAGRFSYLHDEIRTGKLGWFQWIFQSPLKKPTVPDSSPKDFSTGASLQTVFHSFPNGSCSLCTVLCLVCKEAAGYWLNDSHTSMHFTVIGWLENGRWIDRKVLWYRHYYCLVSLQGWVGHISSVKSCFPLVTAEVRPCFTRLKWKIIVLCFHVRKSFLFTFFKRKNQKRCQRCSFHFRPLVGADGCFL